MLSELNFFLEQLGQAHLAAGAEKLSSSQLEQFLSKLKHYEPFLAAQRTLVFAPSATCSHDVRPCTTFEHKGKRENREQGEVLLKKGAVGCLILAGGQGSRLGFDGPKGMVPVTPISGKSLFQVFAERTAAASIWAGAELPLCIMTSELNHEKTCCFFEENAYFGLAPSSVFFFKQEQLPFIDEKGNWQLKAPGELAEGPDGNGQALHLFFSSGLWEQWKKKGIEYLSVIPVDNALADPFDLDFIGFTKRLNLDAALKAVERLSPQEAMGVIAQIQGRMQVIEYSELPEHPERFSLSYAGMFCLSLEFIHSLCLNSQQCFPLHLAQKLAKLWQPTEPHLYEKKMGKCEYFLFDLLSFTSASAAFVCPRNETYAPLKNASGDKSLATVKQALLHHDNMRGNCITPFGRKFALAALDSCFCKSPKAQEVMSICKNPNQLCDHQICATKRLMQIPLIYKLIALLFAVVIPFCSFASLLKTFDMVEIKKVLTTADENTLVVFDNDDIVTTAVDAILQSQNRKRLMELEQSVLFSKDTTDDEYIRYQSVILKNRKLQLVDPLVAQMIHDLQSKNIRALLLTNSFVGVYGDIARYEKYLYSELRNLGIDFQNSWKDLADTSFTKLPLSSSKTFKSSLRYPMFYHGMILTISSDKGSALSEFLAYSKVNPKKIIFIDNKDKHLKSVEKVCQNQGIEFVGIEFNLPDMSGKKVNERVAQKQIQSLKDRFVWVADDQL